MNKKSLIVAILSVISIICSAETVDPNHTATGGYGHLINQNDKVTVWWAEGAYKIMKDAPVPTDIEKSVSLSCAGNEWESFAIVIDPKQDIKGLDFKLKPFKKVKGRDKINGLHSEIRKVEYVNVSIPTDDYGKKGLWPDPMPLFEREDLMASNGLQPYWFSVKLPKDTPAGDYVSTLVIKPLGIRIPVRLHVWDFSLPDSPTLKSMFGFYIDGFTQYDHLKTKEQKMEVFENHMAAFRDFKIAPYDPFEMTPLQTEVSGVGWKGGSYDSSIKHNGRYSYRIEDASITSSNEARTADIYPKGNGDGRFFYPLNREPNDGNTDTHIGAPVPSIRLQFLRDGIEDYEYFKIYEQLKGKKLSIPESIYTDGKTYDKNPADVLTFRKEIAESIEKMKHSKEQ